MSREIKVIPQGPHHVLLSVDGKPVATFDKEEGTAIFNQLFDHGFPFTDSRENMRGPFPGGVCPPMEHDGDTVDVLAEWPDGFSTARRQNHCEKWLLTGKRTEREQPLRWWHLPQRSQG